MKEKLENLIKTFIKKYSEILNTTSSWKEPLIICLLLIKDVVDMFAAS